MSRSMSAIPTIAAGAKKSVDWESHDVQLVSVVIPCYKQAHFLAEAIESALNQTYSSVEIIVVNDGSPDDTNRVVQRYPNVRLIEQRNQGLSASRNAGIRESRGNFLIFLDADDKLRPNAIKAGLHWLNCYPECAFVSGGYVLTTSEG